MTLLSLVSDPLDYYFRPSLLLNRQFDEDDFPEAFIPRKIRRMVVSCPYSRNWVSQASKKDQGSTVAIDKDKFQVSLDVQQFTPEEITVKACGDNMILVEGKHDEKQDEHGLISRHFVRKYTLPEGHDINQVHSKLSSDGVLTITAPKHKEKQEEERVIPIDVTGQPSKPTIEVGGDDKKEVEEKRDTKKRKAENVK